METNTSFTTEWQALTTKREAIIVGIDQLKRRIASLPNEPEIARMLEEKGRLKNQLRDLLQERRDRSDVVEEREKMVRNCNLVISGKQKLGGFKLLCYRFFDRYETWKKKHSISLPMECFVDDTRNAVTWPVKYTLAYFSQQKDLEKEAINRIDVVVKETNTHIANIEEHFREAKDLLKQELQNWERQKTEVEEEIMRWIIQDRKHLDWMTKNASSYQERALRLYRVKFPTEDLSELLPASPEQNGKTSGNIKPAREKVTSAPTTTTVNRPIEERAWEFLIASGPSDLGVAIPAERYGFLGCIKSYLIGDFGNLAASALYEKLETITRMTLGQRQAITRISDLRFHDWKRIKIGPYRIALLIDENAHRITFILCKKGKEFYRKATI